ncbi:hypothetical protein HPP92_020361 [Vanilla planifolia]|uniref:LOB domain-containing protein n=1 Tax=Vanilla planifolia TaxID=51239 RepID=A0A835PWX7_VANPL|nr:hypothetical protein HPP92_020361 [Vanilla planifolia]
MAGAGSPCGACKFLRRKCTPECIFAPYFCSENSSACFAAVHKIFGASNASKLLQMVPVPDRCEAAVAIAYEAQARLSDPVYGCVAHIFALQQQVAMLQAQLVNARAQLEARTRWPDAYFHGCSYGFEENVQSSPEGGREHPGEMQGWQPLLWKTTESSEVLKRKTRKSMKVKQFHLTETCKRFKPYILMVLAQIGYTFLYFFTEASFNKGMSPHIYVTYRNAVASFVICPFAYFLDRACLTLNMYFASIRYTSPTFVAAVLNTVPAITFVIAVLLRLEFLDIKSAHGKAKVAGTIISLAGATTMTFYKGTALKNQWGAMIHIQGKTIHENWLKGSILVVSSSITWSIWYIIQAGTIKRYPAQLSLTAWMCFIGGAQSAVFAVLLENNSEAWHIGLNINLWNVIYSVNTS